MDALEQQKIQVMIDMATKNLRNELGDLRSQMSSLQTELGNVKKTPAPTRAAMPEAQPVAEETPQRQLPQERQPATEPIDRNGVAPETVSIEKMFYCGNKRF